MRTSPSQWARFRKGARRESRRHLLQRCGRRRRNPFSPRSLAIGGLSVKAPTRRHDPRAQRRHAIKPAPIRTVRAARRRGRARVILAERTTGPRRWRSRAQFPSPHSSATGCEVVDRDNGVRSNPKPVYPSEIDDCHPGLSCRRPRRRRASREIDEADLRRRAKSHELIDKNRLLAAIDLCYA